MAVKSPKFCLCFIAAIFPFLTLSAGDLDGRLAELLRSREFDGASVSILAVTSGGDTLMQYDATRQLVPASNMKLVTTALALHSLGGDYRYETTLGYSGEIRDGVLCGDLYIVGGGDPTLGAGNRIAVPIETVFSQWAGWLRSAGIREIRGRIIGDGRAFPGMMEQGSWQLADCGTYYGTGVSGLSFYENVLDFKVAPGTNVGDRLDISPTYPDIPWMSYSYACSTGKPGSGNSLYFYTTNFAAFGEMRGTLAIDRKPLTEHAANKFPEYTVAWMFAKYLRENGIGCDGGPADLGFVFSDGVEAVAPEELSVIGSTHSPKLSRIIEITNKDSNNHYAETLMKTLGKEYCGRGCYDSAYVAVNGLLRELGVRRGHEVIRDGSGLSRENHLSASFLCSLLAAMMDSQVYSAFLGSLPWPGSEGTLKSMMSSVPETTRRRIRAKSGTMGGVRCLSGYILPPSASSLGAAAAPAGGDVGQIGSLASSSSALSPDAIPEAEASSTLSSAATPAASVSGETIIFSIMVNNHTVSSSSLQKKIDAILRLLYSY